MIGKFISIEGLEGAGKTTQAEVLVRWLTQQGHSIVRTREPGGTPIAEEIRRVVLNHYDEPMDATAELLLVFAARKQHVEALISPAINDGKWVVSDRFTDATYAYQGGGRQLNTSLIAQLEQIVLDGFLPDLTIWFDCDAQTGLTRARARGTLDRIENEDLDFFNRCRDAYAKRVEQQPHRFIRINASNSVEQVSKDLVDALELYFE